MACSVLHLARGKADTQLGYGLRASDLLFIFAMRGVQGLGFGGF